MVHKAGPERKLSMKSRLIIIAIMFVIINLIFYFGFDSSDESDKSIELDDTNQMNVDTGMGSEDEMMISVSP